MDCDCHYEEYDPWQTHKSRRKFLGPDVLKVKILGRLGVGVNQLAKRFRVSSVIIRNAIEGVYDERIEEWKRGRSSSTRRRFVHCFKHARKIAKRQKEVSELRRARRQLVQLKQLLRG